MVQRYFVLDGHPTRPFRYHRLVDGGPSTCQIADMSKHVPMELRKVVAPLPSPLPLFPSSPPLSRARHGGVAPPASTASHTPTHSRASYSQTTHHHPTTNRAMPCAPVQVEHLLRISNVELHLVTASLTYKLRCGSDAPTDAIQVCVAPPAASRHFFTPPHNPRP